MPSTHSVNVRGLYVFTVTAAAGRFCHDEYTFVLFVQHRTVVRTLSASAAEQLTRMLWMHPAWQSCGTPGAADATTDGAADAAAGTTSAAAATAAAINERFISFPLSSPGDPRPARARS